MVGLAGKTRVVRSRSARAGITFPVSRFHRRLKSEIIGKCRIGLLSPVYVAAVAEYLSAEVLELAGNAVRDHGRHRITPRMILLAMHHDDELNSLIKYVTIPGAGVTEHIHSVLLPGGSQPSNGPLSGRKSPVLPSSPGIQKAKKKVVKKKVAKPKAVKPTAKRKPATLGVKAAAIPLPAPPSMMRRSSSTPKAGTSTAAAKPPIVKKAPSMKSGAVMRNTDTAITILSEKDLSHGQRLTVIQGDITSVTADALIHPTNATYYLGGFIGGAFSKRGGKAFVNEVQRISKKHGPLTMSQARISAGYNLSAGYVIHCCGPTWKAANAEQLLSDTVVNILQLADESDFKTIAFPAIGSGKAGFPKQTAVETILKAICAYFKDETESSLKHIYFVLYDKESIDVYTAELMKDYVQ